jgi:hypothetical protein
VEAAVPVPQLVEDVGEPVGAVAGGQLLPDAMLEQRLDHPQIGRLDAGANSCSRYSVRFRIGVRLDCRFRTAQVRQAIDVLGKLSHRPPRRPVFWSLASRHGSRQLIRAVLWTGC